MTSRKRFAALLALPLILGTLSCTAQADPWKDESGHGHGRKHKGGDYKEEYWDGHCKVERKWKGNGEYKEERKCKDNAAPYQQQSGGYYAPEPAIVVSPQVIIRP